MVTTENKAPKDECSMTETAEKAMTKDLQLGELGCPKLKQEPLIKTARSECGLGFDKDIATWRREET
jgi:hypothetical protein